MKSALWIAGVGVGGMLLLAGPLASCSASGEGAAVEDDAEAPADAWSSPVDAADGAAPTCDAGADADCPDVELTCDEADFCAVADPVIDTRWALTGISGTSKSDVWAVGSAGTIVHFDGTSWSLLPLNTRQTLYGVWAATPNEVWITGAFNLVLEGKRGGSGIFALERDSRLSDGLPEVDDEWTLIRPIYAVLGKAGEVFLGGDRAEYEYETQTSVWRAQNVDGEVDWKRISGRNDQNVRAMWLSPTDELWTVGDNKASHAGITSAPGDERDPDGLVWTAMESWTAQKLRGVWGASDTDVWAIGTRGTIRHWRGGASAEIVDSPTTNDLNGIWGSGPNDIWAIGENGTILHFDGARWSPRTAAFQSKPAPDLRAIWGSAPDNVWIAGDGVILQLTAHGAAAK